MMGLQGASFARFSAPVLPLRALFPPQKSQGCLPQVCAHCPPPRGRFLCLGSGMVVLGHLAIQLLRGRLAPGTPTGSAAREGAGHSLPPSLRLDTRPVQAGLPNTPPLQAVALFTCFKHGP